MNVAPILEATGVTRIVQGKAIVRDVSVALQAGETLGLIGPNGSGKSTLLNMMAGLLRPSRGDVRLAGQAMASLRRRQIAQMVAFVAQQADTGDRISVRDAVELGRTPWLDALRPWSPDDDEAVTTALRAVGMEDMAGRDWSTLSGGERQRVHIARAHAQQPRLLILDEPTNHLDIHHQIGILDLIETLSVTTVIALHDLSSRATLRPPIGDEGRPLRRARGSARRAHGLPDPRDFRGRSRACSPSVRRPAGLRLPTPRLKGLFMLLHLTLLFGLLASPAMAETFEVKMLNRNDTGPMPFEPEYLVIKPGDTVKFLATDPGHNAATIAGMIPEGGKKFIGKINQEIEVTLTEEGIWGIKCSPHFTMGMAMLIQVGDKPATETELPADLPPAARKRMIEILARRDAAK
jgi:iron complex transport system ATP-binding protein